MMTNNPMALLLQGIQRRQDPKTLLQQLAMQDPRVAQAQRMMAGKSEAEIREMCENMCRERHVSLEDVARSLGIQIRSQR